MLCRMYPGMTVRFAVDSLSPVWTKWMTDDGKPPGEIAAFMKSTEEDENDDLLGELVRLGIFCFKFQSER